MSLPVSGASVSQPTDSVCADVCTLHNIETLLV